MTSITLTQLEVSRANQKICDDGAGLKIVIVKTLTVATAILLQLTVTYTQFSIIYYYHHNNYYYYYLSDLLMLVIAV